MRASAQPSTARNFAHGAYDTDERYAHGELLPGERVGPPLAGSRGKILRRGSVVLLIALGGGWWLMGGGADLPGWVWRAWSGAEIAAVSPPLGRKFPGPVEPSPLAPPADAMPATKPAALDRPSSTLQPLPPSAAAARLDAPARPAAPPSAAAALPPAATGADNLPASPLPPPQVDPADPYQMRAEAVGLHPGLSRVLLARLSATDFRNAGTAVQTAVAETPDDGVFVWPRQRKPELALFQVRFVPGAAPDCRRYVVTVTKDGWVTTALPMERCGVQPSRPRRAG